MDQHGEQDATSAGSAKPSAAHRADHPASSRQAAHAPLVGVLLAVSAGMIVDRVFAVPLPVTFSLGGAAWLAVCVWRQHRCFPLLLGLALLTLGAAWHHIRWFSVSADDLAASASWEPLPASLRGEVATLPETLPAPEETALQTSLADERTRFVLNVSALRRGDDWVPAAGLCVVIIQGTFSDLLPGDELELSGQLARHEPPGNPGEFDFAADQRAEGSLTVLRAAQASSLRILHAGSRMRPDRFVAGLRARSAEILSEYLPQQQVGFAASLLIGQRQNLGRSRRDAFLLTNSMHFLAISGLHIGILAAALFGALRLGLIPMRWALAAIIVLTTTYLLLAGGEPPALRSVVLVIVACSALATNRISRGLNSLALAGLIVLALNPNDLFRVGPQLSFLAVLTLIAVAPACGRLWQTKDPLLDLMRRSQPWPRRLLRVLVVNYARGVVISAGVWLVTAPLVAARFHLLSPLAVVLSPLLWPLIAGALFAGFALLATGAWLPLIATTCAAVLQGSLTAIDWLVHHASQLPLSHFWVCGPDDWWLAGCYGIVCAWLLFPQLRMVYRRSFLLAATFWLSIGAADGVTSWERPLGEARCTVLSMRHGCCVVAELPDGRVLVYDAGRLGSPRGAAQSVAAFLWERGITSIDLLTISHDDADHFNAVPRLLAQQFTIHAVAVPPGMLRRELYPATQALQSALVENQIPVTDVIAGEALLEGSSADASYTVRVLHPPAEESQRTILAGNDNAQSIVLLIEFAGHTILLPGDLEPPGLNQLLATPPLKSDLLLAPHHGSLGSDPPGFAAWSSPAVTVISGGRTASARAVAAQYADAGSHVFHTADSGAVTYLIRRDGQVRLWSQRREEP